MFIDTGALVARYLNRDQYHGRAALAWREISEEVIVLKTTTLIVAEALNLISKGASAQRTASIGLEIYRSLHIEEVGTSDAIAALSWMSRYADQNLSFVDCTSFVVMRRLGLKRAFTFDRHFAIAGFEVWPV